MATTTGGRARSTRWLGSVCIGSMLAIGAVGCASGMSADTASKAAAPTLKADNGVQSGDAKDGQPPKASAVDVLDQSPAQSGRKVVSTATMTVKVADVVATKDKANAKMINDFGGVVFGEQTSLGTKSTAVVTYKVPPEAFGRSLRDLAALGKLAAEEIKTDDVTQQVVDLDARIKAAESSTQHVTDLVGRTTNVAELAKMEDEVQRRQAELESLRGQRQTLEARTELATIVMTITSDDAPPAPPPPAEATGLPGFFDGLRGGWTAFASGATVLGAVLGALLPFSWLIVLAVVAAWLLGRHRRRVLVATVPGDA